MATAVTQSFAKYLEPGLRKIFFTTYKEKEEQFSKVFNVDKSEKAIETDLRQPGFTDWNKKGQLDATEYEDIDDPIIAQYRHETFSKGFQVTKEMVDDDQYNIINKKPKDLARTARATIEKLAASVLNDAFTPKPTNPLGEALISDQHQLLGKNVGSLKGVNKLSEALTEEGLELAFKLAREQIDETGGKIQMNPKLLVVPPALEFTAEKIAKSIQLPGTNFNDINPMRGRFQVVVMDYLTDPTAWFLIDPDLNPLQWFWREKLNFKAQNDFDTDVAKYKGRFRCSFGWTDWRGIIGSKP
jgi:phage major head subunit gpT-like protein